MGPHIDAAGVAAHDMAHDVDRLAIVGGVHIAPELGGSQRPARYAAIESVEPCAPEPTFEPFHSDSP